MKNRGKEFEKVIKKNFEKIAGVDVERIKDSPNNYAGVSNKCDYTVYRYPCLHYIECKENNGASLPLSKIREEQLNKLPEKEKIHGVTAGFIIWLQSKDRTFYVSATDLYNFFQTSGKKSFNPQTAGVKIFDIPAKKKKVYFDYKLDKLLDYLEDNNG